jgi:hypothetical protein
VIVGTGSHAKRASARHRMQGVLHNVRQRAGNQRPINLHTRQVGRHVDIECDALCQSGAVGADDFVQQFGHINSRWAGGGRRGKARKL